jgi:VanZ family protein
MKPIRIFVIFVLLSILLTGFIFSNSCKDGDESHADSGRIVSWLKPLLDPENHISAEDFSFLIRKVAHFTEFFALGVCLSSAMFAWRVHGGRLYVGRMLLLLLAIAGTDEFLQRFFARTSSLRDVLLDFAGGFTGFLVVCLLLWIGKSGAKARAAKR